MFGQCEAISVVVRVASIHKEFAGGWRALQLVD